MPQEHNVSRAGQDLHQRQQPDAAAAGVEFSFHMESIAGRETHPPRHPVDLASLPLLASRVLGGALAGL